MAKRTKIICTIGPASEKETIISRFIKNGMNNARLNFSHGTHDNHKMLIRNIRAAAKKNKEVIGIIADLQGPKIRMGNMGAEGVNLANGEKVILTTGKPDKKKLWDPMTIIKKGEQLLRPPGSEGKRDGVSDEDRKLKP